MRPIMHGDVVAAARVLYALPARCRSGSLERMLQAAARADRFRRKTGLTHPEWGDGSLMVAALAAKPPPEPGLEDSDYCGCMAMVFEALVAWVDRNRASPARS